MVAPILEKLGFGGSIGVYVPTSTDVTSLAPCFALPPFATAVPA